MNIKIIKHIKNIKFPKSLYWNNLIYIFGIESKIVNKLTKFIPYIYKFTKEFQFIKKTKFNYKSDNSILIWDVNIKNDILNIILEEKSVDSEKHSNKNFFIQLNLETLDNPESFKILSKTELYPNHLIHNIYETFIFTSVLEIDEEIPEYYWGKYLFQFYNKNTNNSYRPIFDKIVNYKKDKGHLLHHILRQKNKFIIYFSIRHKIENYIYKYELYTSETEDFIHFNNTKKINIENNYTNSNWYCYLNIINIDDCIYILLNQDDFGKKKDTLIATIL